MPSVPASQPVGRPRDAGLDANVLRAAMELLGEGGFAAVTMDAVAQRASAGKASLYRRWRSKDDLLADALTLHSPVDIEVDTGTLRGDLLQLYEQYYGIGNHVMQAAVQEVLGNMRQHLAWAEKMVPDHFAVRRAKVRALFERAVAPGELAAPAAIDLLHDLVPAMLHYRYNTRGQKVTRASIARFVDAAVLPLAGLAPREPRR
jgi:AcrR family transcriptional regulator